MNRIRTTIAATSGLALLGVGLAPSAQAAPDACEGKGSSCTIVSRADVDGDGVRDSVSMVTWGKKADNTGKVTTRVATADGEKMHVVTTLERHRTGGFRGAARVDGEGGYEIVVRTDLGAHTASHQVLTYRDGRLKTLQDPRSRWRWITDGSAWSSMGYTRGSTSAGAPKMIAAEAVDTSPRDGTFRQSLYSAQWKHGKWQRLGNLHRTVSAQQAAAYGGWHVPYLGAGI